MLGLRSRLTHAWLKKPAGRRHAATLAALRDSGRPPRNILFLCYGNICRSPVAEKLFRRSLPDFDVASAGFYPEENRPSPPNIQEAARSLSLDLSGWSSRRVTQEMVNRADLVILHDLKNFREFRSEFPADQNKIVLLGLFLDPPQFAIADPYGWPEQETLKVVRLIESAVRELARQII